MSGEQEIVTKEFFWKVLTILENVDEKMIFLWLWNWY